MADHGEAQELDTRALAGEPRSSEKLYAKDASLSRRLARYLSIAALLLPFAIALEITCRIEDRIAKDRKSVV